MSFAVLAAAALTLGGCSGGTGGAPAVAAEDDAACSAADTTSAEACGQLLLAVTDADGDFASYTVDVLSVTLERVGGGAVEVLPAAARVDFAALTELSELLSATTLAPGDIVGGTVRLDYSAAEIFVESGGAVVPAQALDGGGQPLGIVDLEIRLPDPERLVVTRQRAAFLSLDFDLAASHDVDLGTVPVRVTTRPYLVAEVRPLDEKEMRLRGTLVGVDSAAGTYDVHVRPWHRRDGDFGIVTVETTTATTFEIGEDSYVGAAGLEALAALEPGALTVAFGTFGTFGMDDRKLTAQIVHATDSVGGVRYGAVHGNVVARDGDRLTVRGALAVHRNRPARFRRTVVVDVGPGTGVVKRGEPGATLDAQAISVGQRIVALGEFENPQIEDADPAGDAPLILDATAGRVRLLPTRLHGIVESWVPGQLNLRLRAIDRLGIALFDFAGTGMTPTLDADPADYEVASGTLSLAELEVGRRASVVGFVAPFGAAPPDFEARTVVDHRDIPALLVIGFGADGTTSPFLVMQPQTLVPDLANPDIGGRHHLKSGGSVVDLLDLAAPASIGPAERGAYGLWAAGHIELFTDFAQFVSELGLRLSGGDAMLALTAAGEYDEAEHALAAARVAVHLQAAP